VPDPTIDKTFTKRDVLPIFNATKASIWQSLLDLQNSHPLHQKALEHAFTKFNLEVQPALNNLHDKLIAMATPVPSIPTPTHSPPPPEEHQLKDT